ncbi:hypothetical protein [Alicyclobacillus sp. SP_1]|uniref:hypothetical protein n=1 Tax=Alicyclobacillus sp. SP_1 TaxID=2942475 RepID=UPI002157CB69|nr:hypothetical protein [Alicyclobacillus sp. SP_1]
MCTYGQCYQSLGKWVQFQTKWGVHRGIVQQVTPQGVLMRVPRQYAPSGLASYAADATDAESERLDAALVAYGYGPGPVYAGNGAYRPYGNGRAWGYPGYGAYYAGWWWWWLAFA